MKKKNDYTKTTYVLGFDLRRIILGISLLGFTASLTAQVASPEETSIFDLTEFEVVSESDSYGAAIETMRSSVNNITVLDSGVFGDVTEGNVGEFMKYLPGVTVDYVAADVRAISVRGMAATFTPVTIDGNRMASAASSGSNRTFELEQVSLNNVERIEVAKVPRPDMSADSLGGSVNLVSKTAFDEGAGRIDYKAYVSFNSEAITLSKSPGWGNENKMKIYPGFDFSYYNVIADGKVGLMINYLNSNQFNIQQRSRMRWEFDEVNEGVENPMPILRRYQMQDGPKFTHRESLSIRTDFKISDKSTLTASIQWNNYDNEFRNTNIQWDTNVDERSDSNGNIIREDYVESKDGGADIDYDGSWRNKYGDTWHGDLTFKHFGDDSMFDVGAFWSLATNHYDDISAGHLNTVTLDYDWPGTIVLSDFGDAHGNITPDRPTISVLDDDGVADPNLGAGDITIYDFIEMDIDEADSTDEFVGAKTNYLKTFDVGDSRLDLKFGAAIQDQARDAAAPRFRLRYTGSDDVVAGFLNEAYSYTDPGWGLPPIAWPDYSKGLAVYEAHPEDFEEGSRADDNAISRATEIFKVDEQISAAYAMFHWHLFDDKLSVLGGFRWEKTEVTGTGEVLEITVDDEYLFSPYTDTSEYDDVYPSLHFKYSPSDNTVIRLAYAKTIGRPNFSNILPNVEVNSPDFDDPEHDPADGSVDFNNTGLLPQEADNFDLTFEYYNSTAGVMSIGLFRKDFTSYITGEAGIVDQALIDEFNLPDTVLGYEYDTKRNGGDAMVEGVEFNLIQSMEKLKNVPDWTRPFTVIANATFLSTEGNFGGSEVETDLAQMTKNAWNVGITYERSKFKIQLKYNDQGAKLLSRQSWADDAKLIFAARETLDLNLEYRFTKRVKVFLNARNILAEPQDQVFRSKEYGILALDRREQFGTQYVIGIKGTF